MREMDNRVQAAGERGRMANLDLLRCVAMMMVVVLHYLGKGGLLADLTAEYLGVSQLAAWLLECFCIVAVNVYMLISGYFLCQTSFKPSRLIQFWLQVWTYSVVVGLIGALSGVLAETDFDTHYLLTLIFPVSMDHYWFMTAYFFLYALLPFVGLAAGKMTKRQMQLAVGLLLCLFCVLKSILPVRLETDERGYDCLWYLCVFMAAAYVRRFGISFLKKKWRAFGLYVGGCLLIFGVTFFLREIYLRTGSLERVMKNCLEYNHVFPFLAALGLFGGFQKLRLKGRAADIVSRVASCTLGVYLLHENLGLRYSWQSWFGADSVASAMKTGGAGAVGILLLWTALAAAGVFLCGILIEALRKWIFGILHKGFFRLAPYRGLVAKIDAADGVFREKWQQ